MNHSHFISWDENIVNPMIAPQMMINAATSARAMCLFRIHITHVLNANIATND